jgi:coenzyme PQQ precursor peptide PqqA
MPVHGPTPAFGVVIQKETTMAWKTPKIAEVAVGMEINMYACAKQK